VSSWPWPLPQRAGGKTAPRTRVGANSGSIEQVHSTPPLPQSPTFEASTANALQVAWEAGQTEARKQKEFLVADTSPPCVIVRAYGDRLTCAEFAGVRLLGQFHLLSKEDRDLELKLKKVGPLQPAAE
jgi:hypothetical protein